MLIAKILIVLYVKIMLDLAKFALLITDLYPLPVFDALKLCVSIATEIQRNALNVKQVITTVMVFAIDANHFVSLVHRPQFAQFVNQEITCYPQEGVNHYPQTVYWLTVQDYVQNVYTDIKYHLECVYRVLHLFSI